MGRCRWIGSSGILAALIVGLLWTMGPGVARQCPSAPVNNPQMCKNVWQAIGLPESNKDERACQHTFVCHKGYVVRHNNETKTPDWVIERLTKETVEALNTRPHKNFVPEAAVPESGQAKDPDYLRSGYARGHQAASADFAFDTPWMEDTFYFSNSVPQVGGRFNSSIWSQFEKRVRQIATERGEIYVITGPIYQDPQNKEIVIPEEQNRCGNEIRLPALVRKHICGGSKGSGPNMQCDDGVAIPAGLFKIIMDVPGNRVNAYICQTAIICLQNSAGLRRIAI